MDQSIPVFKVLDNFERGNKIEGAVRDRKMACRGTQIIGILEDFCCVLYGFRRHVETESIFGTGREQTRPVTRSAAHIQNPSTGGEKQANRYLATCSFHN